MTNTSRDWFVFIASFKCGPSHFSPTSSFILQTFGLNCKTTSSANMISQIFIIQELLFINYTYLFNAICKFSSNQLYLELWLLSLQKKFSQRIKHKLPVHKSKIFYFCLSSFQLS